MKTSSRFSPLRYVWHSGAFSPGAFVIRAVLITICYAISKLVGLQEYTTFLSGTSANLNLSWQSAATLGLIHLLLYVGFILLVPIFLITAVLLTTWARISVHRGAAPGSVHTLRDRAGVSVTSVTNILPTITDNSCSISSWREAGKSKLVIGLDGGRIGRLQVV